jgi:adenylate cyclase class 2
VQNLEAKFKLSSLERSRAKAEALGYVFKATLRQRDTFFRVSRGKLKLREEPSGTCLIHYDREARDDLKLSSYEIVPVAEPESLRAVLSAALGVLAEVRKERTLLMKNNVRLHLDNVDGLGAFGEIEAVLDQGVDSARSRADMDDLIDALEVRRTHLIGVSYAEMLRPV